MRWWLPGMKWLALTCLGWIKWIAGGGMEGEKLIKAANTAGEHQEFALALALYSDALNVFRKMRRWDLVLNLQLKLGYLSCRLCRYAEAQNHYEQAIDLARTRNCADSLRSGLFGLALIASARADSVLTRRLCDECSALCAESEDTLDRARVYTLLASVAGTREEARGLNERALAIFRKRDYQRGVTDALCGIGFSCAHGDDADYFRACLDECLELCSVGIDDRIRSYALNNLGNIERFEGRQDLAAQWYRESLELKAEVGDDWAIAYTIDGFAAVAADRHDGATAARLYGAANAIRRRLGTPVPPSRVAQYHEEIAEARKLVDPSEFERLWSEGAAVPPADVVREALESAQSAADSADVMARELPQRI